MHQQKNHKFNHDLENRLNLDNPKLHQLGAELRENELPEKLHQVGVEMPFPAFFGFVPWRHHVEIVTRCASIDEALFYIQKAIEEEWSRI